MRFLVFLLFISATVKAQKKYPEDVFRSPLDIPLLLSGTFGELRSNHFHSGVDIKTQQREGLSILSIGDGYISRIKVSPWGFGKALYITHPNGYYTSVYAHLKNFSPEIEAYVKSLQYKRETYNLEVYPKINQFKVSKGQLVAYSGNTGSSGGPHLHFEIRDASQRPINPLFFGMDVTDTKIPTVGGLYGYSMDNNSQINQVNTPIEININEIKSGIFKADKVVANGKIGFGIQAFDGQDYTANKNGVYTVEMFVNGTPYFGYDFEKFSFSETRYINTLIDYENYKTTKQRIQKCFISSENPLSIYHHKVDNGILEVKEGLTYLVTIKIKDFKGNESSIEIPIEGKKQEIIKPTEITITDHFLRAKIDNNYTFKKASVFFPKNTFYENFYIDLKRTDSTLTVHNDKVPAHKNFTINFDASEYTELERRKLFIARLNDNDEFIHERTSKKGAKLSTKTRNLGTFTLAIDTIAPTAKPVNFKNEQALSDYKYLRVKMHDDLSGIATYRATINGKWILMEYEPKKDMLSYNLNDLKFDESKYKLKIILTDNVGNTNKFIYTLYPKK